MLSDLESLEKRVPEPRQEGAAGRQGSEDRGLGARPGARAAARAQARAADQAQGRRGREARSQQAQLLTAKPVLYVCNVDEGDAADGQCAVRARVRQGHGRGRRRRSSSRPRSRPRSRPCRPTSATSSCRPRPARNRPRPRDPRRLRTARPDHLLHRRPQGSARLDRPPRRQGAGGRRRDPHRFRTRLHPRRDHRLRRLRRAAAAKPARATPASCARKARNMSSRTATSCCSASTSRDPASPSPRGTASSSGRRQMTAPTALTHCGRWQPPMITSNGRISR